MSKTITEYINHCHECQLKARVVVKDRISISVIPRDPLPFAHLYMDVIGPLLDRAEYKYCLCLIDTHTRYPFAFPLRSVTAKAVCECLLQVFALEGVSSVITSDQGTCFTAELTEKFLALLGGSPKWSTPFHTEGNSLVERLNQSVKRMLAHVCKTHPKQWHKLLPIVLWCIREATNETIGVSPFMMVMGRNPGNPLSLIKDSWSSVNPLTQPMGKTVSEYLTQGASNGGRSLCVQISRARSYPLPIY